MNRNTVLPASPGKLRRSMAYGSLFISGLVGISVGATSLYAQTRPARTADGLHTSLSKPIMTSKEKRTGLFPVAAHAEELNVNGVRSQNDGGGGMMRIETAPHAVQTVGRQYIEMKSPASTVLDLVRNLPSLNVSTSDTSGMQGGRIQARGLTDLDMGLMVDGAPSTSAKYLAEEVDSENIESVVVTPGTSAIDLPVTSAAGGVVNEKTHQAAEKFGGLMDFSYGTNNLSREFIRLESGEIGRSGVRSYFSFSNAHSRAWMGSGINQRKHIDFGLQKDWLNGSNARLMLSWNGEDYTVDHYPDEQAFLNYKKTGQGYGRSADPSDNNYWKNNNNHWNEIFLTAPVHIILPERVSFDVTPYLVFGQGWTAKPGGVVGDSSHAYGDYAVSGHDLPVGTGLTSYFLQHEIRQVGATAKLNYAWDTHNRLTLGYWYENYRTIQSYPTSMTMENGVDPSPNWAQYKLSKGSYNVPQNAGYELHALFLEESGKYLRDLLTYDAGFKFVMSNTWNKSGGEAVSNNTVEPLPHLSVGYRFNGHHQIYINAEGDYRQASPVDLGWLYISDGIPKNQYSIKEEIGYRYNDKYIIIDASFFNYNVTNRILEEYIGANSYKPIQGGNETMRGFDFMIAGRSIHGFSPYASVEYLNATQDSDVCMRTSGSCTADQYLAAKGRQAIMAPHVMANFGLTYKYRGFFANATVHYTGPQSVSVADDQRIPGYVTDTLSLGYRFKSFSYAKSPTFRLNFTNLTGSVVRTGAVGAIYQKGDGVGNAFMVEPRFSMTGTVSTEF